MFLMTSILLKWFLQLSQGTLSGAPKHKALQLINQYEKDSRGYYGGCIGMIGLNGTCNQAIMIRTFKQKQYAVLSGRSRSCGKICS
jgi:anthranilate/para-aminobenzoate synthase component I